MTSYTGIVYIIMKILFGFNIFKFTISGFIFIISEFMVMLSLISFVIAIFIYYLGLNKEV